MNLRFCELDFGDAFDDQKVRERAIADRVNTILGDAEEKHRFYLEYKDVKLRKKASVM